MAKTRRKREVHHDHKQARVSLWQRYQALIVFSSLSVVLLGLVIYGGQDRTAKITNLATEAQTSLSQKDYQRSFDLLQEALMLAPNNPGLHFQLAQLYKITNNWEDSRKELLMALSLSPDSTSIQKELTKVQTTLAEPGKIAEELNFWKREVALKPDYRDGWLQLAVRHYELYQMEEAKIALEKAFVLDPNFETTKKLREIIK